MTQADPKHPFDDSPASPEMMRLRLDMLSLAIQLMQMRREPGRDVFELADQIEAYLLDGYSGRL